MRWPVLPWEGRVPLSPSYSLPLGNYTGWTHCFDKEEP